MVITYDQTAALSLTNSRNKCTQCYRVLIVRFRAGFPINRHHSPLPFRRSGQRKVGWWLHRRCPSPTAPRPCGQGFVSSPLKGRGESHTKAQRREEGGKGNIAFCSSRHPELGSGSICQRISALVVTSQAVTRGCLFYCAMGASARWTLKQVQGDGALKFRVTGWGQTTSSSFFPSSF
jgi:hypothetical protein